MRPHVTGTIGENMEVSWPMVSSIHVDVMDELSGLQLPSEFVGSHAKVRALTSRRPFCAVGL